MKPQMGNSNLQIEGFMNNGQAVNMTAAGWINEPKEMKGSPEAMAAIEQIQGLMLQHRLVVSFQVRAKQGDDPTQWPKIGSWTMFPNQREQQQQQQQAPQQQQAQQQWQQPQQQSAPWRS